MTAVDAIRSVLAQYATFDGRARRAEYWWWSLVTTVVQLGLSAVGVAVLVATADEDGGTTIGLLGWLPLVLVSLAFLLPSLSVAVRRLHDTSRSGWWLAIGAIPVINIVTWIVLLVFLLQDGDRGANRYGPDPKGAVAR